MGNFIEGWYVNRHATQFDPNDPLKSEACVPAAVRNGVDAATAGRIDKTEAYIHRLIPKSQEQFPGPGWSLEDADRACDKLGVPFTVKSGQGVVALRKAWDLGQYTIIQGDSDRFSDTTCSGAFNGQHAIGCHPYRHVISRVAYRWINDGICNTGRWEKEATIISYAQKLNSGIRFGVFTTPVLFLPDTATESYRIVFAPKAAIRSYTTGSKRLPPPDGPHCIEKPWVDTVWGHSASSAPCGAPVHRETCDGKSSATTALVMAGAYAGQHIRVGAEFGVTVVKEV